MGSEGPLRQDAASLVAAAREKLAARHRIEDLLQGSDESQLAVARQLLKVAAARNYTRPIGKALYVAGKGAKKGVEVVGDLGAGLAEGLNLGETGQAVARRGAQGTAIIGGTIAGSRVHKGARRRVDEFRFRHGLYRGM